MSQGKKHYGIHHIKIDAVNIRIYHDARSSEYQITQCLSNFFPLHLRGSNGKVISKYVLQ